MINYILRMILVLSVVAIFWLLGSTAFAAEYEGGDWFREGKTILWTIYGEETKDASIEFQYSVAGIDLFPRFFSDIGLAPTAIVGNVIYESNPAGETGSVIWSRVTAYYDDLFDVKGLEGRAIYDDFTQGSYLGSGIGYRPVGNIWMGGFYLEGGDWMLRGETAYRLTPDWIAFGRTEYYLENELWEGLAGFEWQKKFYIAVENRNDEWIAKLGASWPLE